MTRSKPIGLIGGMGPYASAYFYKLLLDKAASKFGAKNNDDFPEILLDSVPVPDFISDTRQLDKARGILVVRIKKLVKAGCGVLAMVCNTGHILYLELLKVSRRSFISMIDLVAEEAKKRGCRRVGILTTPTAKKMRLYSQSLGERGIEGIYIDGKAQKIHEQIIREVVAGNLNRGHGKVLYQLANGFIRDQKLDGIILGCTELPLVFPKRKLKNVIDCLDVLADELLVRYYKR